MKFNGIALLLCGICIGVFVLQVFLPALTTYIALEQKTWFQPWRLLTAIVAHGSLSHLLYNIFALALFGSILEILLGARKFLMIFFGTGIAANILGILIYPSSLGASGAIFGVIGTLVVLRPGMVVFAFGIPMPMFLAAIFWAAGDVIGLFVPSNVGNVAHLAGLVFGLFAGALLRQPAPPKAMRSRIIINEKTMRDWEDKHLTI